MLLLLLIKDLSFVYEQRRSHKFIKKCWFDQKKRSIIKHKNLLSHIKVGREIITFGNAKVKKQNVTAIKFYFLDLDIENVLVSNKTFLDGKYFIDYFCDD